MFKHYVWASSVPFTVRVSRPTSNSSKSTTVQKKKGTYIVFMFSTIYPLLESYLTLFKDI